MLLITSTNDSISTPCYHETQMFLPPACLCNIPTNVTMTAAAPADNNGDQSLSHYPSLSFDDDNPTLTPINQQEWEAFYNKFIQFANSFNTVTPQTNDAIATPMPAISNSIDCIDRPLVDDSNTDTPDLLLTMDTSPTASIPSGHSLTDPSHFNTDTSTKLADDDDHHHLSPSHTANKCVHLDTLYAEPPYPDEEIFDYKANYRKSMMLAPS